MLITIIIHWKRRLSKNSFPFRSSIIGFLIVTSVIFGMSHSNFGLIVRQKCQIIPVLAILYAQAISIQQTILIKKKIKKSLIKTEIGRFPYKK